VVLCVEKVSPMAIDLAIDGKLVDEALKAESRKVG
jgi:hypothetical protein